MREAVNQMNMFVVIIVYYNYKLSRKGHSQYILLVTNVY
jgi:hypothetical protein